MPGIDDSLAASMRGMVHTPRLGSEVLRHPGQIIRRASLLVFMMNAFSG